MRFKWEYKWFDLQGKQYQIYLHYAEGFYLSLATNNSPLTFEVDYQAIINIWKDRHMETF